MRFRSLLAAICLAVGVATMLPVATASAAPAAAPALNTCNHNDYVLYSPNFRVERLLPLYNGSPNCQLQVGDYDNQGVFALQWALIVCYGQPIAPDSDFGGDTRGALIAAQSLEKALGETVRTDGLYDPQTRSVMLWPYRNAVTHAYFGCLDL